MRPLLVAWLARHGLPGLGGAGVFPARLAGDAGRLGAGAASGGTRRRLAPAHGVRHRLRLRRGTGRRLPVRGDPRGAGGHRRPLLAPDEHPGRAAYGGLLFAIAAAALYLQRAREPLAPFFDRVAIGAGLTFALVRTGCFLAGCDYGLPTAHAWGVRFPPGSLAALDHARAGSSRAARPAFRFIRPALRSRGRTHRCRALGHPDPSRPARRPRVRDVPRRRTPWAGSRSSFSAAIRTAVRRSASRRPSGSRSPSSLR